MNILPYQSFSNQKILEAKGSTIQPQASLSIGFYNNLEFLYLVLASLEAQTFKNFEVIIADDGSKPEVVAAIHDEMRRSPLLIQHLWHADAGWKKVEMLNKVLVMSSSDYIITIDQDCILHPEFVAEHIKNREPGTILSGRRAEFTPFINRQLSRENVKQGYIQKNFWWMLLFMFYIKDNQWLKGLHFKTPFLRRHFNRKHRALVGCNMSFYKSDLVKLNGYDMEHAFPCGAEDADIEYRALKKGLKIKSIVNMAVQYHLFHKLRPSNYEDIQIFYSNRREKNFPVKYGYRNIHPVEKTFL